MLPDFLIIGAFKAGTTSLFHNLMKHPQLSKPLFKEPHYFSGRCADKSWIWYRSLFPFPSSGSITGEASTTYFSHPRTPQKVKKALPKTKIILLLRNPVERALCHYYHSVKWGNEDLDIEQAFSRPLDEFEKEYQSMRIKDGYYSKKILRHGYLFLGAYSRFLNNWYEHFEKEEILLLNSEDLWKNPKNGYTKIFDFLELEPYEIQEYKLKNKGLKKEHTSEIEKRIKAHYQNEMKQFYKLFQEQSL
jgi:hypothetical protein